MKIITDKQQKEIDAILLRKLKFMGMVCAERVARIGTVNYDEIDKDAEHIAATDDIIFDCFVNFKK